MTHAKSNFAKGMMTGAIMGATTAMIVEPMLQKKQHKHHAKSGTFKKMGNTVGSVVDTFMNLR